MGSLFAMRSDLKFKLYYKAERKLNRGSNFDPAVSPMEEPRQGVKFLSAFKRYFHKKIELK